MNLVKIDKFISECRKKQGLTQVQLADKLNITDRAVSKWETGRALPDASLMLDLCDILKVSVNDLLSGKIVNMNKNEEILWEMVKEKENSDRILLKIEIYLIVLVSISFLQCYLLVVL